jgi:glutathione synthase/RimK-type ligase-like ATP-grasp enzyme
VKDARVTQTGDRPGGWVLFGVPGDRRGRVRHDGWDKLPALVIPGTAAFLRELEHLPFRPKAVHFGAGDLPAGQKWPRLPCINFMADADVHAMGLGLAEQFVSQMGAPCFNRPAAVLGTGRDEVARRLETVPGLVVPRTVKANETRMAGLRDAMARGGITYPVIVRMAGDQGGISTVRVDSEEHWEALHSLAWGGKDVYLTQYVDYRDPDGHYRKLRLSVIGDEVVLKHQYVSSNWMVHFRARVAGSDAEEEAFLANFESNALPALRPVVREVAARLQLDYFGIDASLRPDGSLLLFEANATMSMLDAHAQQGSMWQAPTDRIRASLIALLGQPRRWLSQGSA